MTYREHPPPPALAAQVLCVWSQQIGADGVQHRVLPDGCADVVWIGDAPPAVAGPATGPVIVPLAPHTQIVGIRLRHGAVPAALGLPASELLDRDTPLADLWGAAPGQAALHARLARAAPPDPLITAAIAWLARHPAGRISALARRLDLGPRLLHRRFKAAIGYGPKTFQRILRLQRLLSLARHRPSALAMLAAEAGYADQAHMSREVQALTGRSPARLLPSAASTLELSEMFKTAAVADA